MDRRELLDDPTESFRVGFEGGQAKLWTAIPGVVTKVDLSKMTCEVQPAIKGQVTDEAGVVTSVNLPLLGDVPICFPAGGGFMITFPLAVNDEVLVIFASRCIDAWWQSGGIQAPMELRMHDLSDGFAIPGPRSVPNVPTGISGTALQIRNLNNTARIEMDAAGGITLVSASTVAITSPAVSMSGALTVTGAITTAGGLTSAGKSFAAHVHSGVTTGTGNSGPPV